MRFLICLILIFFISFNAAICIEPQVERTSLQQSVDGLYDYEKAEKYSDYILKPYATRDNILAALDDAHSFKGAKNSLKVYAAYVVSVHKELAVLNELFEKTHQMEECSSKACIYIDFLKTGLMSCEQVNDIFDKVKCFAKGDPKKCFYDRAFKLGFVPQDRISEIYDEIRSLKSNFGKVSLYEDLILYKDTPESIVEKSFQDIKLEREDSQTEFYCAYVKGPHFSLDFLDTIMDIAESSKDDNKASIFASLMKCDLLKSDFIEDILQKVACFKSEKNRALVYRAYILGPHMFDEKVQEIAKNVGSFECYEQKYYFYTDYLQLEKKDPDIIREIFNYAVRYPCYFSAELISDCLFCRGIIDLTDVEKLIEELVNFEELIKVGKPVKDGKLIDYEFLSEVFCAVAKNLILPIEKIKSVIVGLSFQAHYETHVFNIYSAYIESGNGSYDVVSKMLECVHLLKAPFVGESFEFYKYNFYMLCLAEEAVNEQQALDIIEYVKDFHECLRCNIYTKFMLSSYSALKLSERAEKQMQSFKNAFEIDEILAFKRRNSKKRAIH